MSRLAELRAAPEAPWYRPVGHECDVFEHCFRNELPLMLRGPTGSGKSRFVEHMAARLGRPLVTVAAHDDTSATDLCGRWVIQAGETKWQDGPVTRAVRQGAILYIDEIAEARSDVIVVLHPLGDHRRQLFVERHDEELEAADGFMLVVSWNPGHQRSLRELKPSTRQRFVGLSFDYPAPAVEEEILVGETEVSASVSKRLVALAAKIRAVDHLVARRAAIHPAAGEHGSIDPERAAPAPGLPGRDRRATDRRSRGRRSADRPLQPRLRLRIVRGHPLRRS